MKKHSAIILFSLVILYTGCNSKKPKEDPATESSYLSIGKLKVYYEYHGSGDAVLLLHAGFQDHHMWKDQVAALSKNYKVVTVDLPYHGATTGEDTSLLVADLLHTMLDSLHIKKTSVVGLSMGSNAAQDFIIAYPERVNKVILISAGINGYDREHKIDSLSFEWYPRMVSALEKKDTIEAAKIFTRTWAEGLYRTADSLQQPVSQYVFNTTLQNMKQHRLQGWPVLKKYPLAIDLLGTIQVPVLIIHGDKDLPYMMETNKYLEAHIPGAKRVLMKDVAHMLNIEKPEEVNKLIIDFLQIVQKR
jgi:3-oxoadipate enol-lactonase